MKIILIANSFTKNMKEATNITTLNYAKELQKKGHDVVIIAEKRINLTSFEIVENIPIYRYKHNFGNIFADKIIGIQKTLLQLQKRQFHPDIIHTFSSSMFLSLNGILAKKIFPKSKIIHTIKSESQYHYDKHFTFFLRFVDLITVATKKQAQALIQKGIEKEKTRIISSHINLKKFRPLDQRKLQKKYGFSRKTASKIILNYGAMREDKGTYDLFESIPAVVKEHPSVLYIFVCRWKKIEEWYLKFVQEHNLEKNVIIITDDVNIEEYVNLADLAIFPYQSLTRTESNPSCVLECLACKTPVITTDLEELLEILKDQEDCIMIKPKDSNALAAATLAFLKDTKSGDKIAEKGFKIAQHFAAPKITQEMLQEYQQLLDPYSS